MRRFDEAVRQAGLAGVRVTGKFPSFTKLASAEGVVVAVHPVDAARNRSRASMEYDVRDIATGQIYWGCRRTAETAGADDGDSIPLRAATRLLNSGEPAQAGVFDPVTAPVGHSDGDRVLLSFVGGAHHAPVIVGCLEHPRMSYGTTVADGYRRVSQHRGTRIEKKDDGSVLLTRPIGTGQPAGAEPATTVTLDAGTGDVTVVHGGGRGRVIVTANQVIVDGAPANGVLFGENAVDAVIKGTSMQASVVSPLLAAVTTMQTAITAALTPLALQPGTIPATRAEVLAVATILQTLLTTLNATFGSFASTLSNKVRTE